MSIEISYKGNVIASVEDGKKAIVRCNDDKMKGDIEVVSTSSETPTQEKTIDITANGTVEVTPDEGHALSKVTANVDVPKEGVDKIQRWIELSGDSTKYLFYNFAGTSVDELMAGIDTSNVTDAEYMFAYSTPETVPMFDTSKVANMKSMFYGCKQLLTIPEFNTNNVTNFTQMFSGCSAITVVPALDLKNIMVVTGVNSMFYGNTAMAECWLKNIRVNIQVGSGSSYGHLLTLESLLHLCKECIYDYNRHTLTIGTTNLAKLEGIYVKLIDITDDMRAEDDLIDKKYPFVQCESTDEGVMTMQEYMATKMWSLA